MFAIDTPKEMKLLRKINKLQKTSKEQTALIKDLGIESDDFFLQKLMEKGYILSTKSNDWGAERDGFILTDKGKYLTYYRFQLTKEQIRKSVILPIVVAFLTTLITNYLLPAIISLLTKK